MVCHFRGSIRALPRVPDEQQAAAIIDPINIVPPAVKSAGAIGSRYEFRKGTKYAQPQNWYLAGETQCLP